MNIPENNPYRVLGVYSNSPTKERLANYNRMKAFLKVGKSVSFLLDLPQYLPAVSRTEASVADAEVKLTLPKDQMLYAQFWFVKMSPLDGVAFNHLLAGDMAKALEIWKKVESVSSLQNRIVCSLIREDYAETLYCAEALYGNEKFVESFVSAVIGTGGNVDSTALAYDFLDTLCEEVSPNELFPFITNNEWKEHIEGKAVKPLIEQIQDKVEIAKKSSGKGAKARLEAGEALMRNTKEALIQLRSFLSETDLPYQMIADKLGLEILQCGIDFYNDSDYEEAAYKAMPLFRYAQSVVVGKMAKDRCNENVEIMEKILRRLPPIEILHEHQAIQTCLIRFKEWPEGLRSSIQLLKECAPHVVAIKEALGEGHPYYLKISTRIVDTSLAYLIKKVNEAQDGDDYRVLKSALIDAWRTQLCMDKFDLEPEYKEGRYKQNRETLYNIIDRYKGFEKGTSGGYSDYGFGRGWCNDLGDDGVDLRTDYEFYLSCYKLEDFRSYIKHFPRGKYLEQAKAHVEKLAFREARTITELQEFIREFPNSQFIAEAKDKLRRLVEEENRRKVRIARQNREIAACKTLEEICNTYSKERANGIDINKCSDKAFGLSKTEKDYRKVVSIFGKSTQGGRKAQHEIDKIELKRRIRAQRKKDLLPVLIFLGAALCIIVVTFIFSFSKFYALGLFLAIVVIGSICTRKAKVFAMGLLVLAFVIVIFALGSDGVEQDANNVSNAGTTVSTDSLADEQTYQAEDSALFADDTDVSSLEDEDPLIDTDYETYINNRLRTGAKPYKAYYRSRTGDNRVDFKTSGEDDYVIIVKSSKSSKVVNHVYVRANDRGKLYLPNGTYNFYFYSGKGWNPQKENGTVVGGFVANESVSKDSSVGIHNQDVVYTLYPVTYGNLHLESTSMDEAL